MKLLIAVLFTATSLNANAGSIPRSNLPRLPAQPKLSPKVAERAAIESAILELAVQHATEIKGSSRELVRIAALRAPSDDERFRAVILSNAVTEADFRLAVLQEMVEDVRPQRLTDLRNIRRALQGQDKPNALVLAAVDELINLASLRSASDLPLAFDPEFSERFAEEIQSAEAALQPLRSRSK